MVKDMFNGFCMALADSVPGVSGGTVAFIMGFYDRFINAIHGIVFGKMKSKKRAAKYMVRLGIGWIIGMLMAVAVLSAVFESHIYAVSSLFIGFVAGSIPLIVKEERESFSDVWKGIGFCIAGILLVAGITWANGSGTAAMDLSVFSPVLGIKLFFIGMIAISAMFLPGISGSTLLLIFGAYIPVISAVRGLMGMNFGYMPSLMCFGFGIIAGAVVVVRIIKVCLDKYRTQSVYGILGMMIGSFYAIINGPTTLKIPQAAMGFGTFNIIACIIGLLLVVGMQALRERGERNVSRA